MTDNMRNAHAVLLPVADKLVAEPWLTTLLQRGTVSLIAGETRGEYVARRMSADRISAESADDFRAFADSLTTAAGGPTMLAVDQEPWGIQRLHQLVPEFPNPGEVGDLTDDEITTLSEDVGAAARDLGVNVFLSPVVDALRGDNPWLEGRTLARTPDQIGRVAAAFVIGAQRSGIVAVAKHFPGHSALAEDQALLEVSLSGGNWSPGDLSPFQRVIDAGVGGIMMGPVVVDAVDANEPSSTSAISISKLRGELGFSGLVVSDGLDSPSTSLGRSLQATVLASLRAGTDLVLLPGGPELLRIGEFLARAAEDDEMFAIALEHAADRVRSVNASAVMENRAG